MSLKKIKSRTEEFGDCHIWQQGVNAYGYPQMKLRGHSSMLVRRIVFELAGGTLVAGQPVVTTCGERLCVAPKHIKASTTSEIGQEAAKRGAWSGIARASKIAQTKRKTATLTMEIAREIRASTDTGPALAAKFGVNRSLVVRIKSGQAWRDFTNPYMGLMV